MPVNIIRVLSTAGLLFCCLLILSSSASAQESASQVEVIPATHFDVSPRLREIEQRIEKKGFRSKPVGSIPHEPLASVEDPVVQTTVGPLVGTSAGLNFPGVGLGDYGFRPNAAPPDTNGAVGATQFVQWVNESFAVFDKTTGALVEGPVAGNSLWTGFGGGCEANNDGDPIVQYDKAANRWVMTQFSVTGGPPFFQCVAVSTTSDAMGTYARYSFSQPNFNDYPKLGVWPDAYYISFNMFSGNTFVGGRACAFDRSAMLAGSPAMQICFQLSRSFGGLLPSDLDGSAAPPAGSPNFFLAFGSNSLNIWKFHADFATPANSTFAGPTNIPVAAFSPACGGGGTCVPQLGTSQKLDSLADRLMYRLAYRNFGDHESLVVNHSVAAGTSVGVRWYELRSPGASPNVYQQGTYAPDSNFRWMGSIAMDHVGDIAVGYSVSSSSMFPAIRYTGRVPSDPLGTLGSEATIIDGTGSQLTTLNRWGDYSSISIDPVDDCTFWYTSEYLKASGTFNWSTRIGSFKFPSCGAVPDFLISATPESQTVTQGQSTSYAVTMTPSGGFTGAVSLSVSGLPSAATASFDPNPTTSTSSMSVTTASSTPAGSYPLTITGTSGTLSHSATVTLVVNAVQDFSVSASPPFQAVAPGAPGTFTVTVTPSGAFAGTVDFSISGLPPSWSASFDPPSVTASGSSTLMVFTDPGSADGDYQLTIMGTAGGLTRTTTVTVTIDSTLGG